MLAPDQRRQLEYDLLDEIVRRGVDYPTHADRIAQAFAPFGVRSILLPGSGTGPLDRILARRGFSIHGIEFDARAVDCARRLAAAEGLPITYHQGDFLSLAAPGPWDAVALVNIDLSPESIPAWYAALRRCLPPGRPVFVISIEAPAADTVPDHELPRRDSPFLYRDVFPFAGYEVLHYTNVWYQTRYRMLWEQVSILRHPSGREEDDLLLNLQEPVDLMVAGTAPGELTRAGFADITTLGEKTRFVDNLTVGRFWRAVSIS